MKRRASAVWRGGLKDGKGTVSTESRVLSTAPYNFRMRFENEKGTNPEELVAAAHLTTTVKIPNADNAAFKKAAEEAKSGCPISKLLSTLISLDATLV